MQNKKEKLFCETLNKNAIEYFSFCLFYNKTPAASNCNSKEWLDFYVKEFNFINSPPVQKYITSSKLNVIMWECFDIDLATRKYISMRNEVVGVNSNVTILNRKNHITNCFTFGTSRGIDYLMEFIDSEYYKEYLSTIVHRPQ